MVPPLPLQGERHVAAATRAGSRTGAVSRDRDELSAWSVYHPCVVASVQEGSLVGERFRLLHRLGEGGMGQVWAGRNIATRRRVALKLLSPRIQLSSHATRRLKREARLASQIEHPHVIDVLDLFDGEHGPVMVMELLEGETLAELIAREAPLTLERAATILLQVVSAVGAAHERGIVHRDLKPTNIFITAPDGVVKVLDFGIARITDACDTLHDTSTGQLLGTPMYMAPEQHCAEPNIDHRADVWAVGVLIYELLSGERPLHGRTGGQVMEQLTSIGVPPLRALVPDAPFDLAILARRMLEREQRARPDDLRPVASCLERYASVDVPPFGPASTIDIAADPDDKATTTAPMELTTRVVSPRRPTGMIAAGLLVFGGAAAWALQGLPVASSARHGQVTTAPPPDLSALAAPTASAPEPRPPAMVFQQPELVAPAPAPRQRSLATQPTHSAAAATIPQPTPAAPKRETDAPTPLSSAPPAPAPPPPSPPDERGLIEGVPF